MGGARGRRRPIDAERRSTSRPSGRSGSTGSPGTSPRPSRRSAPPGSRRAPPIPRRPPAPARLDRRHRRRARPGRGADRRGASSSRSRGRRRPSSRCSPRSPASASSTSARGPGSSPARSPRPSGTGAPGSSRSSATRAERGSSASCSIASGPRAATRRGGGRRRRRGPMAASTRFSSIRPARVSARSPPGPTRAGGAVSPTSNRWRPSARRILANAVAAARPGGRVVYSTCTISRRENEDVAVAGRARTRRSRRRPRSRRHRRRDRRPLPADPQRPRSHGRLLHRLVPDLSPATATPPTTIDAMSSSAEPELLDVLAAVLSRLRRALAAPDPAARAVPLRQLPAALRARLAVPGLRDPPDHRADERRSGPPLPGMRHLDAAGDLSGDPSRRPRRSQGRSLDPLGRLRASSARRSTRSSRPGRRSSTST